MAHDLTGIGLNGNLTGTNFAGQNLTNATIYGTVTNADFSQANLANAHLDATLTDANFAQANLTNATVNRTLINADFSQANLTNASFASTYYDDHGNFYIGADLTGANLTGAEVRGADFTHDSFYSIGSGITVAQLYSTASYQAHDLSGIRLGDNSFAGVNLASQNLTNTRIYGTLTTADFRQAILANAYLGATLTDANFAQANLSNATVGGPATNANFSQANLTNVIFAVSYTDSDNNLHPGADLTGANLTAADSRGALGSLPYSWVYDYNQSHTARRAYCRSQPLGWLIAVSSRLRWQSDRDSAGGPADYRGGPTIVDGRHRHAAAGVRHRSLGLDNLLCAGNSRSPGWHARPDFCCWRKSRHPNRPHD